MKKYKSVGDICQKVYGFEFRLCKIEYVLLENQKYKYIFTPNYNVIDLLEPKDFQGIPGLNLDLRCKKYARENITPVFISERVPNTNRLDFYDLLKEVGLDYYEPIKYLINTKKQYFGDNFYVRPSIENKTVDINDVIRTNNLLGVMKIILSNLALGNFVKYNDLLIGEKNMKDIFKVLLLLYKKSMAFNQEKRTQGIKAAKQNKVYKGRKPIEIDMLVFKTMLERVSKKELTSRQAAKKLNISIDKYYRLKKKMVEKS